jgi:N-acetyl-gamma-glutamyl-phosphate reductase
MIVATAICLSAGLLLSLFSADAFSIGRTSSPIRTGRRSSTSILLAKPKVFIDGETGTTGLQVRDRLASRDDIELLSAPTELRKDVATRKRLINEADAVILCTYGWRVKKTVVWAGR